MIDCPNTIAFSEVHALKRQEAAEQKFGKSTLSKYLGYAFFLLGAKQKDAAQAVGMPVNTYLSFQTRMGKQGLNGLFDRRQSVSPEIIKTTAPLEVEIIERSDATVLRLSPSEQEIVLKNSNPIQKKVVLLTFASNGLISLKQVAETLGFSEGHTKVSMRKLQDSDVTELIDKRAGQQQDYRFTPEVKGQLLTQWAANTVSGRRVSSPVLADDLRKRSGLILSERGIRYCLEKLGVAEMSGCLLDLVSKKKRALDGNN